MKFKEIEKERAKERLATSTGGKEPQPVENLRQAEGKARDLAAKEVGISGKHPKEKVKETFPEPLGQAR